MKKLSNILLNVFSVGVLLALFAGALSLVGFLVAFIIGGDTAPVICEFIYKTYFSWVIRICTIAVGCGLVGMYITKQRALSIKQEKEDEKDAEGGQL